MIARRLPFLAVAGLGALVVHQLAYGFVSAAGAVQPGGLLDHSHLPTQWAIITPLAVVAAVVLILRQVRQLGYRQNSTGQLSAASGVLYLMQEGVETVLADGSVLALLATPPVVVGLALAPLVAALVTRLLADVAEVVASFVARDEQIVIPPSTLARSGDTAAPSLVALALAPSRGPPLLLR